MSLADTIALIESGVLEMNFVIGGRVVAKGTGFMCQGYLLTNNHVIQGPEGSTVWIRRSTDSERNQSEGLTLPMSSFRMSLRSGSDPSLHDYAILDLPQLREWSLHNFVIRDPAGVAIGEAVSFLGYPFEHKNLCCHVGIVSSFFERNGVHQIQIDASVNAANSGGPLFLPISGEVIGIVTRKATGLSDMFDRLRVSLKGNLEEIKRIRAGGASVKVGGIDPVQAAEVTQSQLLILLDQIERSANVGIGYAFSAKHLLEDALLYPA